MLLNAFFHKMFMGEWPLLAHKKYSLSDLIKLLKSNLTDWLRFILLMLILVLYLRKAFMLLINLMAFNSNL